MSYILRVKRNGSVNKIHTVHAPSQMHVKTVTPVIISQNCHIQIHSQVSHTSKMYTHNSQLYAALSFLHAVAQYNYN